jgi:membrane protease YdiL (CAAX protease family)
MRDRGVPLASLVGGSWRTPGALVRDIGLAMAFTVLGVPLGSSLMYPIGGNGAVLIDLVPHTGFELALWLMLSASAGFCEELIFRGYILK